MELKTIDDYYEQVYEKFPFIPHSDIQRILKYGWRYIYLINSRGGDIFVNSPDITFYMGRPYIANGYKHFRRYVEKLAFKIRTLCVWHKKKYSGYYYFGITQSVYDKIQASKKKRGRPKEKINYGVIKLFKYFEECKVAMNTCIYFYRVPYPIDLGNTRFKWEFITKDAELIYTRERPLTFEDILVSNNKYEYINASSKHFQ